MVHDHNRSRTEELAHHAVAWRELEHVFGDLEHDAGALDADVVVRRVTQRSQDIVEIHAAGAQAQTHLAGPEGTLGFGARAQGDVA